MFLSRYLDYLLEDLSKAKRGDRDLHSASNKTKGRNGGTQRWSGGGKEEACGLNATSARSEPSQRHSGASSSSPGMGIRHRGGGPEADEIVTVIDLEGFFVGASSMNPKRRKSGSGPVGLELRVLKNIRRPDYPRLVVRISHMLVVGTPSSMAQRM